MRKIQKNNITKLQTSGIIHQFQNDQEQFKFIFYIFYNSEFKDPNVLEINENLIHNSLIEFTKYQHFLSYNRFQLFFTPFLELMHSRNHDQSMIYHIAFFCSNMLTVLIYTHLDNMIHKNYSELKEKDIKIAKIVHDLKNPILSIKQIINNIELPNIVYNDNESEKIYLKENQNFKSDFDFIFDIQKQINLEIEDVEEMIENLKTEFKSNNQMKFKEEIKEVKSTEFLESFKNAHTKLTESSKNQLTLSISPGFPVYIEIAKSIVKRILNNFISNSLKHTSNGEVELNFWVITNEQLSEYSNQYQEGSELNAAGFQLCFQVKDNGKGISKSRAPLIFAEKESDESGANWDGCGLGLPICSKLSLSLGARIFYHSIENEKTTFLLVMNIHEHPTTKTHDESLVISRVNSLISRTNSIVDYNINIPFTITLDYRINLELSMYHKHQCNSIIIAEDNTNILKRYKKYLEKKEIPYMAFMNGSDCLSQVLDDIVSNCIKCNHRLIITDMHMPFMDGEELARQVRIVDKSNTQKLVLLSADEPSSKFKKRNLFDEIQIKPFNFNQFIVLQDQLKKSNSYTSNQDLTDEVIMKQ